MSRLFELSWLGRYFLARNIKSVIENYKLKGEFYLITFTNFYKSMTPLPVGSTFISSLIKKPSSPLKVLAILSMISS